MELNEILELRKSNKGKIDNYMTLVETEKRTLTEDESKDLDEMEAKIVELDKTLEERKQKNVNNITLKNKTEQKMEKYSLIQNIRDVMDGRQHTSNSEIMFDKGKDEFRKAQLSYTGQILLSVDDKIEKRANITAKDSTQGQEVVAEEKFNIIGKLRDESVLAKAGATIMSGLIGDISIPVYAGTTAAWKTEVSTAVDGAGAFSEVSLAPFRITAFVDISKNFLLQDSASAEGLLYDDMSNSTLELLEQTILDASGTSSSRPAGMFNGVSFTTSGATTFANFVALETAVGANNALKGNPAYIVNSTTMGDLKTTSKDSGSGIFITDGVTANGRPIYASNAMPTISGVAQGCIFGNFSDLLIGQWGGIDVTVDPYTQAATGQVRLVVNSYWGWVKRRTNSFSYGALA